MQPFVMWTIDMTPYTQQARASQMDISCHIHFLMWRDIQPHILTVGVIHSPPSKHQIDHVCVIARHSTMIASCYNWSAPFPDNPVLVHSACNPIPDPRQCDIHDPGDTNRYPNWIQKPRSSLSIPILHARLRPYFSAAPILNPSIEFG